MRSFAVKTLLVAAVLGAGVFGAVPMEVAAQTSPAAVPTLIPVSGEFRTAEGQPRTGQVLLVISLYEGQNDTAPRWIEHQQIVLDAAGRYSVQFGGTRQEGLPADLFTGEAATRWIGVAVEGEAEQPRVTLLSVPYAAKAASADTLAGKPVSDFVLSSTFREDLRTALQEEGVNPVADDISTEAITNSLQKSNGGGGLLDSTVYDVDGNVGIGTSTPASQLHLSGFSPEIRADRVGGALGLFRASGTVDVGSFTSHDLRLFANSAEVMRVSTAGRVGIGTATPASRLHIVDNTESEFRLQINGGPLAIIRGGFASADFGSFSNHPVRLFVNSQEMMRVTPSGNIGIGTASPSAKLHVGGDISVDGNIAAKYQDVAEWVPAAEPLDAGTVVIIDVTASNRVRASTKSYDTRVAGAVSPQPGLILGEKGEGKVLVAQSGRVRIKADTRNGKIKPGDLLVTSPRAGYAMKAKSAKPGTVLGKALEPLDKGTGEILVLLTLQ